MQKSSQEGRILALLKSRGGAWTPEPELAEISLRYAARLHSLRHEQRIAIENRVEIKDAVKHGFYRLAQPDIRKIASISQSPPLSVPSPASLFGDLTPEPEYPA
jgi:hypothetical protein